MISALASAYGLEGNVLEPGRVGPISRADVYAHYRQGFSEPLANQLTDYSWDNGALRESEPALVVPDSAGVLELAYDHALVAWIPPSAFRSHWGAGRCFVDHLVREGGRWIIDRREP